MNKAILITATILLLTTGFVIAIEPLPKGKCNWIMPPTAYREPRMYQGIYGRFSDGSIRCFMPGTTRHKTIIPEIVCSNINKTKEVCEQTEICENECHWEKYCDNGYWHHGHWVCIDWDWHKICHDDCHNETICHTENYTEQICN